MIDFHVDKAGSVPVYAQLVRQVREAMRLVRQAVGMAPRPVANG